MNNKITFKTHSFQIKFQNFFHYSQRIVITFQSINIYKYNIKHIINTFRK